ncbi:hypothetical protein G9A89_001747 [Geosiphon pyriformis]|nr:hypothetical protein G9A89_001747 [Geosiphon pyriformis]
MSVLVWKFAMCNVQGINVSAKQADIVHWHIFISGLESGFFSTEVVIIMNNSLAHHVFKVEEIPGQVISVQLLFKSKLLVTILGLYADASSETRFGQALKVNFLNTKTINSSTFVVLGGDFNKNEFDKNARIEKTINYIFVSEHLFSAVVDHQISSVSGFFNTNYRAANKDCWKFKIRDVDSAKWTKFKDCFFAKLLAIKDDFSDAKNYDDIDTM